MSKISSGSSPLDWEKEFQPFLIYLNELAEKEQSLKQKTIARYLAAIAIGGYLGPPGKKLLSFRWEDLLGHNENDLYELQNRQKTKIYFSTDLIRIVKKCFKIIETAEKKDFILKGKNTKPISMQAFNKMLKKLFSGFGLKINNASSHTLRKTFAYRVLELRGKDENAIHFVSQILDHKTVHETLTYLGISDLEIKNHHLKIN